MKGEEGPHQATIFSKFSKSNMDFACNGKKHVKKIANSKNNKFQQREDRQNVKGKEDPSQATDFTKCHSSQLLDISVHTAALQM